MPWAVGGLVAVDEWKGVLGMVEVVGLIVDAACRFL